MSSQQQHQVYYVSSLHRVSKAFPPMWVVRCTCKSQDHKCDYLFIYRDVESSICDTEPPRQRAAALLMDSRPTRVATLHNTNSGDQGIV